MRASLAPQSVVPNYSDLCGGLLTDRAGARNRCSSEYVTTTTQGRSPFGHCRVGPVLLFLCGQPPFEDCSRYLQKSAHLDRRDDTRPRRLISGGGADAEVALPGLRDGNRPRLGWYFLF